MHLHQLWGHVLIARRDNAMEVTSRRPELGRRAWPLAALAAAAFVPSHTGLASVLVPFALALLGGIAKSGTA